MIIEREEIIVMRMEWLKSAIALLRIVITNQYKK